MDLGLSLNLEQKQELVMTPQLQMAIELLQFSSQELQEYVDEELKDNPLLEKDNEDNKEKLDDRIENQYSSPSYSSAVSSRDDEYNYENFVSYQPNLLEYLENQLYQVLDDDEIEIGEYILGNLDQCGFARTVLPDEAVNLSGINRELYPFQRLYPGIALSHPFYGESWLTHCFLHLCSRRNRTRKSVPVGGSRRSPRPRPCRRDRRGPTPP